MTDKASVDTDAPVIDDGLYSRQRYAYGDQAMHAMMKSSVLIVGLGGCGVEVAKTLALAGVGSLTLHDWRPVRDVDLSTHYYACEADVVAARNLAAVALPHVAQLNPYVQCCVETTPLCPSRVTRALVQQHSAVVVADHMPLPLSVAVNQACRDAGVPFLLADAFGLFGFGFCDFGPQFHVRDTDGEAVEPVPLAGIEVGGADGAPPHVFVDTLPGRLHGLGEGDAIQFSHVEGFPDLSAAAVLEGDQLCFEVTVVDKSRVRIVSNTHLFLGGAFVAPSADAPLPTMIRVKQPRTMCFQSLCDQLEQPRFASGDFSRMAWPTAQLLLGYRALHQWSAAQSTPVSSGHMCVPDPWHAPHAAGVVAVARSMLPWSWDEEHVGPGSVPATTGGDDFDAVRLMCHTAAGGLIGVTGFIGPFMAQECLKALTSKYTPLNQWLVTDFRELAPTEASMQAFLQQGDGLRGTRDDGNLICLGPFACQSLAKLRVFMVGVGAIGCELLKNMSMLGVGTNKKGKVYMTDPDYIEKSNLNRQFLFRSKDIGHSKAECAAASVRAMRGRDAPAMRVHAATDLMCADTETVYSDDFLSRYDVILNALDNLKARLYMDERCVRLRKALLDAGTLATKGHVQVVLPHHSQSFSDTRDPPVDDIPFCTLKSFPSKLEHCIAWAKDLVFNKMFVTVPMELNQALSDVSFRDKLTDHPDAATFMPTLRRLLKHLKQRPSSWEHCVRLAYAKFVAYFDHSPQQLLHALPVDKVNEDGSPFWAPPKRIPRPLHVDVDDGLHVAFISSYAALVARMWAISVPVNAASTIGHIVSMCELPLFTPKQNKRIVIDPSANAPTNPSPQQEEGEDEWDADAYALQVQRVHEALCDVRHERGIEEDTCGDVLAIQEFEKDDDSNGHIDIIAAAANLRATVYGLPVGERLEIKRIAGRIIPALATTTSVVAAWQSMQLVGIAVGCSLAEHRSMTLNLALPFVFPFEPTPASRTHLTKANGDTVSWTKWDQWSVRVSHGATVDELRVAVKDAFGCNVCAIVHGVKPVYLPMPPFDQSHVRLKKALAPDVPVHASECELVVRLTSHEGDHTVDVAGPRLLVCFGSGTKKQHKKHKKHKKHAKKSHKKKMKTTTTPGATVS